MTITNNYQETKTLDVNNYLKEDSKLKSFISGFIEVSPFAALFYIFLLFAPPDSYNLKRWGIGAMILGLVYLIPTLYYKYKYYKK